MVLTLKMCQENKLQEATNRKEEQRSKISACVAAYDAAEDGEHHVHMHCAIRQMLFNAAWLMCNRIWRNSGAFNELALDNGQHFPGQSWGINRRKESDL